MWLKQFLQTITVTKNTNQNHSNTTKSGKLIKNYEFLSIFIGNFEDWLLSIGLKSYWPQFERNLYAEASSLNDLKLMGKTTLAQKFDITKPGHLKKLSWALSQLKHPTASKFKAKLRYLLYILTPNLVSEGLHVLSRIYFLSRLCFGFYTEQCSIYADRVTILWY